jgi:cell division septal protein FtsQ
VIFVLIFLFLAGAFAAGTWYYFFRARTFSVENIVVNKPAGYTFSAGENKLKRLYYGRNIFAVDLDQVEMLVRKEYPQLKNVEVKRYLPDTIEVDIVSREPFAYLDTAGGIVLDREGMVLSSGEVPEGVTKIRGINFFLTRPSTGSKIDNESLYKALILIEGLQRKTRISRRDIDYIDISDRNNIVLGIKGVEVKIGVDDFSRKLDALREILEDPYVKTDGIRYIDLRFDNPVISPK